MQNHIDRLKAIDREIHLLSHAAALLSWDQETYMPEAALDERSEQLALLSGYIHKLYSSGEMGEAFETLGVSGENITGPELADEDRTYLRVLFREYQQNTALPEKLVTALARQASKTQAQWVKARSADDFSLFSPELEKMLDLTREKAEHLGYEDTPYDALLGEYEPWMSTVRVDEIFAGLKSELADLRRIIAARPQVEDAFLRADYPVDDQRRFCEEILEAMGFETPRGRLDVSAHPFTTTLGGDDVRLTTRFSANFLNPALFGTIHEAGHGLYELGFDRRLLGSVLGEAASMAIHESQSRTWENMIGRGLPFWSHFYPLLQQRFPAQLGSVNLDRFYRGINRVASTLTRVEADEVTYNLHIILRFELEQQLVAGKIAVADIPEAWNALSDDLFDIRPANDAEGCMQDIHWSIGYFGYFPTYALGNLYGAQFYRSMKTAVPDLEQGFAEGRLQPALDWMRKNIHAAGAALPAEELCLKVTGEKLNPACFIEYLKKKYSVIYDF